MNLFNEFYMSLLNEMAVNRKTRYLSRAINPELVGGKASSLLTKEESIKKAKKLLLDQTKSDKIFNEIKSNLIKNKDEEAYLQAQDILNILNGLPVEVFLSKRLNSKKILNNLILSTNSPYHSFDEIKSLNIHEFKRIKLEKIKQDLKAKKLTKQQAKEIFSNINVIVTKKTNAAQIKTKSAWYGLYHGIAVLLTKLDLYKDPSSFDLTEEDLKQMNLEDFQRHPQILNYYKSHSKSATSLVREPTTERSLGDKSKIFYFDEYGEPWVKLITIGPLTPQEIKQYPTLEGKEQNVPLRSFAFQAKSGKNFGKFSPPPAGYKYRSLVSKENQFEGIPAGKVISKSVVDFYGKTINEIRKMVNHDAAFVAFLKKYPPSNELYRRGYIGMDLDELKRDFAKLTADKKPATSQAFDNKTSISPSKPIPKISSSDEDEDEDEGEDEEKYF